jgi:hypothetical protein
LQVCGLVGSVAVTCGGTNAAGGAAVSWPFVPYPQAHWQVRNGLSCGPAAARAPRFPFLGSLAGSISLQKKPSLFPFCFSVYVFLFGWFRPLLLLFRVVCHRQLGVTISGNKAKPVSALESNVIRVIG